MSMTLLKSNTPIGLSIPIRNHGTGFFEQTFDTFVATKNNIINLLRTRPGERRMQPLFGCRIHKFIFEQNSSIFPEIIKNTIIEDINNWIPNVTVDSVNLKFFKNEELNFIDTYKVYMAINFTVNDINKTNSVEIVIDSTRI